jgi:hypothetical protein
MWLALLTCGRGDVRDHGVPAHWSLVRKKPAGRAMTEVTSDQCDWRAMVRRVARQHGSERSRTHSRQQPGDDCVERAAFEDVTAGDVPLSRAATQRRASPKR